MNKVVFLALFIFTQQSFAEKTDIKCLDGKIKYLENKIVKIEKSKYCFSEKKRTIFAQACLDKPESCLSSKAKNIKIKSSLISSESANPTHLVCHFLKGTPQIIQIWTGKRWIKSSRCIFKDKSYVDNDTLYLRQDIYE